MEDAGVVKLYEPSPTPCLHVAPAQNMVGRVPLMGPIPCFLGKLNSNHSPHVQQAQGFRITVRLMNTLSTACVYEKPPCHIQTSKYITLITGMHRDVVAKWLRHRAGHRLIAILNSTSDDKGGALVVQPWIKIGHEVMDYEKST